MRRLLGARIGKDIYFYSISIDPAHDTPEVLKAYMEKFGVGPGWTFLTGNDADIRALTKKLGLSRYSDSANKDGHTAILMVGDEPGGLWVRHIQVPDQVLASGDPIAKTLYEKYQNARMPNVSLGGADAAAIVSYLEAQSAAATK